MKIFTQLQKEFLQKPLLANISVIHSKNNLPIVFPAWVLEHEGKLYLTTAIQAKKVMHLESNNQIGLNVVDPKGFPYLGVSGKAKFIRKVDKEKFDLLRQKIVEKYDISGDYRARMAKDPNPLERVMIEIEPLKIYGGVK